MSNRDTMATRAAQELNEQFEGLLVRQQEVFATQLCEVPIRITVSFVQ